MKRLRHVIEKLNHAGFQRIFCADDNQLFGLNELFEHGRAVTKLIDRGADVCPHGVADQRHRIVAQWCG